MQIKLKRIDHLVITTDHLAECLAFYQTLGFQVKKEGKKYALYSADFKINVHLRGQEVEPHARYVQCGSADFCLIVSATDMDTLKTELLNADLPVESDIVERHGAKGKMQSIYLRDPDDNLVELAMYK